MLKKIAITVLLLVLFVVAASATIVWRYPLAVFNWANRRSLRNTGFVEHKVATQFGTQTIFTKGSGAPVVFLHGAGDNAGTWVKVADFFTARNRVILLDFAGHGESEPRNDSPLSLGTVLQGLENVLQSQAGNERVILVGNSLGGWMAMLYSEKHPDRVERIVLVDGGAIRGERPDLVQLPTTREEARKLFDSVIDPGSPRPADFVLDDIVRQSQNGPIGRLAKAGLPEMESYLLDGKLQGFSTPTDLLWGESDKLIPVTYARRLESQLSASRLTTLPRCGHVPQQECPKAFSDALKKILALPAPTSKPTAEPVAQQAAKGTTT